MKEGDNESGSENADPLQGLCMFTSSGLCVFTSGRCKFTSGRCMFTSSGHYTCQENSSLIL